MARLNPNAFPMAAVDAAGETGAITTPPTQDFDTPAMQGSMQQFLSENLGLYVVIEFLIGTQTMTAKGGVLYAVGTSVVTLYDEISQTFVTCDIFSIKFVTFYLPGRRPWQVRNPLFGQGVPGQMVPSQSVPGQVGTMPPGFASSMEMGLPGQDLPGQGGCVGGNCGGGATGMPPAWG